MARPEPGRGADVVDDAAARKVVTIVFADLIGSTSLHERLDPESVGRLMDRYYEVVREPVEAHGGSVVQLLGDGVMCAFGVPHVAEDDAIRAVRAAVGMQRAFREFAREQSDVAGNLGLRVAVNTGEVVVSDEHRAGLGDPLNVAARLQQEGQDGDVLVSHSTQRLVSALVTLTPVGVFSLKGRSETVAAFRVVSLDRPAGAPATAFVGREDELRRIMAVYDAAVAARRARLAVILGSPGLGKSRLITELARRLGERATVVTARCDAAGGATFAPLAEALRATLHLDAGASGEALRAAIEAVVPGEESERARIGGGVAALLAGTPASPEETFFVVRRLLAALATVQPVVLAIDDLQWAEPLLLDLTEHLVQWSTEVPLLVLVAARPELRDTRSSLAAPGGLVSDVVTLTGLDAGAATRLAANVIGADELPAAVAGRVLATSEGNPLFVGELVRMLVHDGALKREGDRWVAGVELAALEMPPTIQALLAARIERLRPEERTVLERAAVVGRQFSRAAVAHLLPGEVGNLDARLESLRRSELVEPDAGWFLGEPALRFHHVLIRDAAYRRVLKNTRAELHGRFAEWVESRVGEAVEHDETIGWHLEQAHRHLRELGPIDAQGRALGERAARYLAAAGRRALARDDLPLAASLLGRALDRLDAADPNRADLALDWCEALLAAGDVGPAQGAIDELGRFTGDSERLRAWHTCFTGQLAALTDPQVLRTTGDAVAAAAEALASLGDAAGEAKAHFVHAVALSRLGKVGACEAALDRALAAARRGGDRRRSNAVLAGAPLAALSGPSPVTRASGRCLDVVRVLRITQGAPAVEAVALRCQGVLEALRGRTEAARRMIAASRRMVEELGITHRLLEADVFAGRIELLEGDAAAAERCLRPAYDGLREHGLGIDAAQAAALLGRALLAQGRAAEAEALSHESEALAGDDLQAAIAWRGVRAEALARRGEHASAVEFARAAVDIAAATDALLDHADARLALAAALRAAGRSHEAAAEEARAIELWEAKGATLLADRARRDGGRVAEVDRVLGEVRPVRRRVQANATTVNTARLDAAITARDADALPTLFADVVEVVNHPTGAEYGREGPLFSFRALLKARDPTILHEPLATLGDSLGLYRMSVSASGAGPASGPPFDWMPDIGAHEFDQIQLIEVDTHGRCRRSEVFAADRLGDAVVRLYERYAELLPDGPAHARAAATARSVATVLGPVDPDRYAASVAPTIEVVDHRTTIGGSVRGIEAFLQVVRALLEVATDITTRVDDVLALRSDALLVRWTNSGTARIGGGPYERPFLTLWVFGADGLATRNEAFNSDREDEALARFDELTAELAAAAPPRAVEERERRVRANAATATAVRLDAAIATRDADALPTLWADEYETVDHTTGTAWDLQGILASWRSLLSARDPTCRHELLATLGDSLALCRVSTSASGFAGAKFDVGAYQREEIALTEVDAQGRRRRGEVFAVDRLGDAVARLYERYADVLPDGPARARAAATARSVVALLGPPDRWPLAPDAEATDHRTVGFGSLRGGDAVLGAIRALLQLSDDFASRMDDVLALRSDALLVRWTTSGTLQVSGGAFERNLLMLWVFGADGLLTRWEQFDTDREAEALARFDELTADASRARGATVPSRAATKSARRVRPNAATANAARLHAGVASRDTDPLPALFADEFEVVDHTTGVVYDRTGYLATFRVFLKAEHPSFAPATLATLGDSLALYRESTSASGFVGRTFDVGAYEKEEIALIEVDAQGRHRRRDLFATGRLGDAVARLYERYAELLPDGPPRTRAAATARSVAAYVGPVDPDRYAAAFAPDLEAVDHRTLGTFAARGKEAFLRHYRAWLDLADDTAFREDTILGLQSDALLMRRTFLGTDRAGGAFERQFIQLWNFGNDGLITRLEYFDADRDGEALARFDELTVEPPTARFAATPSRVAKKRERRVRANAATAAGSRIEAATAARDADALPTILAEHLEVVDHTTGATFDRQGWLATWRSGLRGQNLTYRQEPLATLGDSLALWRSSTSASRFVGRKFDVGAYESESIVLAEADAQGRLGRQEIFATDRLGDAVARIYERYADLLPDGPARTRAAATARSVAPFLEPLQIDSISAILAPGVEFIDHRTLGLGSARGAEAFLRGLRSLHEVADNTATRVDDVLGLRFDAFLVRRMGSGTVRASGGAYERHFLVLFVFGADGRLARVEEFDADRDDEALARFCELTGEPPPARSAVTPARAARRRERVRPNAATANAARLDAAIAARDADALPTLVADHAEVVDHTTGATYDGLGSLAFWRSLLRVQDLTYRSDPLATLGDSIALFRTSLFAGGVARGNFDVGAYETEVIGLIEVDAQGRRARTEVFAVDRLGDAVARSYERYADLLPDGPARARAAATARSFSGIAAFEWAAAVAPAIEVVDHRTLGTWSARGAEAFLEHLRALLGLADDAATRDDDVLALQPDALLVRRTHFGTARAGGGAYERLFLLLHVFGADGLVTRLEFFDSDREDDALARFDELPTGARLTGAPLRAAERRRRPVRPNAATANAARLDAAIAVRDADALPTLTADVCEVVDHTTGATYGRQGSLTTWRTLLSARDPTWRQEPLATLGDSLALFRLWMSASGFAGATFDVGAYEREGIALLEVDAQGRRARTEVFAVDRLGDAVARLYERYAELLPDGPARARAAAGARAMWGPGFDLDRIAAAIAPAIEVVDHRSLGTWSARGAEAFLEHFRALLEVTDDAATRSEEVLGLHSDAFVVRATHTGTAHAGGGAYERPFVVLNAFGPDGLTRVEFFDAEREDEALARFDELTAEPAAARFPAERHERRVRSNAATAHAARLDAAIAARDFDALPTLLADEYEVVEHTTGVTYDRQGQLSSYRALRSAQDPTHLFEPLATLGDSLALGRLSTSASGFVGRKFDVGAHERVVIDLVEVDAQERCRRVEVFATERLGDAVAQLYERYAEILPDGPARARAAATARSVATMTFGRLDPDSLDAVIAPDGDYVDHRPLGFPTLRGAEAIRRWIHSLFEVADDLVFRLDAVLSVRSDAFLVRWTNFGTDRAGGGSFERRFIALNVFGVDGLVRRWEFFDADRDAEALARFEELTAEPAPTRPTAAPPRGAKKRQHRVRANAATASTPRFEAVFAARDADALPTLLADEYHVVDHTTGVTYDRQGELTSYRALMRARDPTLRTEPLATLGDSLSLSRVSMSASGFVGGTFDVGAYEREQIALNEVDANGRRRRAELFAADRLGDAIVRLYERYAELLPDGPARARAAATARSVATMLGPFEFRYPVPFSPTVEVVDHRILGTWSARGAEALLQHNRSLLQVADDITLRDDEVLSLQADALLVRRTNSGTDRAGGGAYERVFLALYVFGTDGLVTRIEYFDTDREDQALARFDELTAAPPAVRFATAPPRVAKKLERRVRPNAATANAARTDAAILARDADAIADLFTDEADGLEHPTGARFDRRGSVFTLRSMLSARDPTCRHEPLAALGDALALFRSSISAGGYAGANLDVGAYEREDLVLIEVEAQGRRRWTESFARDHLSDAIARLYARYADLLPDGPARARAAATARSVATMLGPFELDRYPTPFSPTVEVVDHRILGTWSARGAEALLEVFRSWLPLADDITLRDDEVLDLRPDALLVRRTHAGTDRAGGGAYERVFLALYVFGADGLVTRIEFFDTDREDQALARFDELTAEPATPRIANAETRRNDRLREAWAARDWERVAACFGPGFRLIDRRSYAHLELDRDQHLKSLRMRFDMSSSRLASEVFATRGDRLALGRARFELADRDVGPSESELLWIGEADEHGDCATLIALDPDDLDAAYAELDHRYFAGEAAAFTQPVRWVSALTRAAADGDREAVAALLAPDFVVHDHSPLGWGTLDRPAYVESVKALVALAPDFRIRTEHLWLSGRGALGIHLVLGTYEGGAFEQPRITVSEIDAQARERRRDIYTFDQFAEARARFEAIGASAAPDPLTALARPNAATAAMDRVQAAFEARDWAAMRAVYATDARIEDRRHLALASGDVEWWIADKQQVARVRPGARYERQLVGTYGDRLALERVLWTGEPEAGRFEVEYLWLTGVDERGRITGAISFDPDDWGAASREACDRWLASDAAAAPVVRPVSEFFLAFSEHDRVRVRAVLADDLVVDDRRRAGLGRVDGADAYVESIAVLWNLAPDIQVDGRVGLALERHGLVSAGRDFGTLAEGGAFERPRVAVLIVAGSRITRFEMFDVEDVDAALARFAELRPKTSP